MNNILLPTCGADLVNIFIELNPNIRIHTFKGDPLVIVEISSRNKKKRRIIDNTDVV